MKKGLIFLFLLALASSVLAQSTLNRLSVEFHSINGGEVVTLNLITYFGRSANFVSNQPEHVDVSIDPETKVATLRSNDPEWRGIEEVIFAVSEEYLKLQEVNKTPSFLPRPRRLVVVNITEADLDATTEPFTHEQVKAIADQLNVEAVNITTARTARGMVLSLNDQVFMNVTFEHANPSVDLSFDLGGKDRKVAEYTEPNEILLYILALIGFIAISVLVLFVYHAYSVHLPKLMKMKEVPAARFSDDFFLLRKEAQKKINELKKQVGREKARKIYRDAITAMDKFFIHGMGVKGTDAAKIDKHLQGLGIKSSTIAKILEIHSEHRDKVYAKEELKDKEAEELLNLCESILETV